MTKVYLVEQHIGKPHIGWRLLAEQLPMDVESAKVGLASSSNTECVFAVNNLHAHDYHAAASGDEYVKRVLHDVTEELRKLKWTGVLQNTGYTVHEINL